MERARHPGCWFHPRVINGDVLKPRVCTPQLPCVLRLADKSAQRHKSIVCSGEKLLEGTEKGRGAPEKHPRIPQIVARNQISLRLRQIGLFCETPHLKRADP